MVSQRTEPRAKGRFLEGGVTPQILDGGVSTELEARGYDLSGPLWSAELIKHHPEAVIDVHRAFFRAGADFATSLTYQAHREGFLRRGLSEEEGRVLVRKGIQLAQQAAAAEQPNLHRTLRVAASCGPLGAALGNGAEYTGRYSVDAQEIRRFHESRLDDLLSADPDVVAIETMPRLDEVLIVLDLLRQYPEARAWVSFTLADAQHLPDGTPLCALRTHLWPNDQLLAVGVNCVAPSLVEPALNAITGGTPNLPLVAYPNRGERYDARAKTWAGEGTTPTPELWVRQGAVLVGGCCRTRPADIEALATSLGSIRC